MLNRNFYQRSYGFFWILWIHGSYEVLLLHVFGMRDTTPDIDGSLVDFRAPFDEVLG